MELTVMDPQLRTYLEGRIQWVRQMPWDARRQATLAMAYAANGLWETARESFRTVVKLDPGQPLAWMYVAIATQELGQIQEAVQLYRDLTIRFPDFAPGYYRLGDASLRLGDVDQAESAFRRLVVLAPGEWRGFAGLGEVQIRRGRYDQAMRNLEKALEIAPEEKIAHHLLGLAYRGAGRTEEAELELRRGLNAQHYPMTDTWAATASAHMKLLPELFDMAGHYSEAGNFEEAIRILEEALKFHPDELALMNRLAVAYNQAGQAQKARALLLRVIGRDKRNFPAYLGLSYSAAALRNYAEAISFADRAIESSSNNAQGYVAKANALLAAERDSEAIAALETALRLDPNNPDIHTTLGDVWLQNFEKPDEALGQYQAAVKADPTFASGYVRIATLEIERDNASAARRAVDMVKRLTPKSPAINMLEERLRDLDRKRGSRE